MAPAVLVRDAAGRAVSGVVVTFSVDSGGGSLAAVTGTTGTDGVATAGAWTLGPLEGPNVASATAAVGRATVRATARYPTTTIGNQTLPPGGGSVSLGGTGPLAGLRIDAPAGAFSGPVALQVGYASALGMPLDTLVRLASPLVTIETAATGAADKLFTMTIPARIGSDEFAVVAWVDPATGVRTVLPTVRYDSTSVTAELGALTATPTVSLGGQQASRLTIDVKGWLVVLASKLTVFGYSFDLGFRPGVDDWAFPRLDTPIGGTGLGQVLTAQYYFLNRKAALGKLWDHFARAPGIPTSDVPGIYWTAGLTRDLTPLATRHVTSAVARRAAAPAVYDRLTLYSTVMAMALTRRPPVLIAAYPDMTVRSLLAYRWDGPAARIYHANPEFPGSLDRYSQWSGDRPCAPNDCTIVAGFDHPPVLASQFGEVTAGTMYRDQFPATFLGTPAPLAAGGGAEVDTLFLVGDSEQVWVEIPSWPYQAPPSNPPQHGAAGFQDQRVYLEESADTWVEYPGGSSGPAAVVDAEVLRTGDDIRWVDRRIAVEARAIDPPNAITRWAGFKILRVIRYAPELVASEVDGAPTTFELISTGPSLPEGFRYRIIWNDGTPPLVRTSKPVIVTHEFPDTKRREVVLEMIHPGLDKVVGRTSVMVGKDDLGAFRLRSVTLDYGTEGPQISSDGRWRVDTTRFERIRSNLTQAAIRLVESPFTRFCATCSDPVVPVGLYLLEGASITDETLRSPETISAFASSGLAGATLSIAPAPLVRAWNLVRTTEAANPICINPPDQYQVDGNTSEGTLRATTAQACWYNPWPDKPEYSGFPQITVDVDVVFSRGEVTGTFTLTYLFPQTRTVVQKKRVRFSFTGTKVVD